jgi:hypothetical protein
LRVPGGKWLRVPGGKWITQHCANGSPGAFPPPFTLIGTLLPDGTLDFQDLLTHPGGA